MSKFIPAISRLIDEFAKLPGVGKKSAQRLAFYVINMEQDQVVNLATLFINSGFI